MNDQTKLQHRWNLREVAKVIAETSLIRNKKSAGKSELLELLRSGKLTARIIFPSDGAPTFAVPRRYWSELTSGKFAAGLLYQPNKGHRGEHLIPAKRFIDDYVDWFVSSHPPHKPELASA